MRDGLRRQRCPNYRPALAWSYLAPERRRGVNGDKCSMVP